MNNRGREDGYESRFMTGNEPVRYRDKRISRGMALVLLLPAVMTTLIAITVALTNNTASRPVPPGLLPFVVAGTLGLGALFALLAVMFAVLRTVVTDRQVIVRYGLWGPTIPLEAITRCCVVDYDWTKFGGWGIRRGTGGVWAYVPAPGEVLELTYRDGTDEKVVQVGASEPRQLAAAIAQARATVGIRIEPPEAESAATQRPLDEESSATGAPVADVRTRR